MIIQSISINLKDNEGGKEQHADLLILDAINKKWTINGPIYPRFTKLMSELSEMLIREQIAKKLRFVEETSEPEGPKYDR